MDNGKLTGKIINEALLSREKAYAPYSRFRVGAAVITVGNKIYTGCNIENSSYGLTCCAERVALFKAVSEGEKEFMAIAVASDSEEYCRPCGACRQVMAQFGAEIRVYMCNNKGEYEVKTVADLLPDRFELVFGKGCPE